MTGGNCRSCHARLVERVLDLGQQPASDAFPLADDPAEDARWPLAAWLCTACHLVQLGGDPAPLPELPRAVESATQRLHAANQATRVVGLLGLRPGARVAEFDSHHGGSWEPHLLAAGLVRAAPHDPVDLVVDVHAIAHEDDLEAALAERAKRLGPGGRLVLEFHHLLPLVSAGQFDTVRHGHPLYLSLLALDPALARHGLQVLAVEATAAYGGSLVVVAAVDGSPDAQVAALRATERESGLADPDRLRGLQQRAERTGRTLRAWLEQAQTEGRRVLGYGAPSKAAVLLTWSGIGPDLLPFTVDLSPAKHGRRIPGARIPIRSPEELLAERPDHVLILTWDIAEEVRHQLSEVEIWGGSFVVPVPEPRTLT